MPLKKTFSNNIKDRHMAVTDGVFAIAMTILVFGNCGSNCCRNTVRC